MNLIVLTPEQELFNGEVSSVKVPGTKGQFEILKGHAPIVSSLAAGVVRIVDDKGQKTEIAVEKGFVEVLRNEVSVLVQLPNKDKQ
ncbi:MAG: ATP synthase F1 subunit epsilon [Saprospiraceae bacterium]|nr:ATP synthase F1 subunit epsilon [Saprospiraceae bacterium]